MKFCHFLICAALLSGWLSAGEPPMPSPLPLTDFPPGSPLVGRWKVQFANGVKEAVRIGSDAKTLVSQPERTAAGSVEVRDRSVVISYQDDRVERWTLGFVQKQFPSQRRDERKIGIVISATLRRLIPHTTQ